MADAERQACRVLVTGATGAMGRPICRVLVERGHWVRGLARRPAPGVSEAAVGDIRDRDAVRRAVEGVDTVIHLAAVRDDADFIAELLEPNVCGLYYVCEAARELGVERLVLASTMQVIGGLRGLGRPLRIADGAAPINHYALTKVWAEAAGETYARCYGLSVVAVRIGWLPRDPAGARALAAVPIGPRTYLSHPDAARFFTRCVESARPAPSEFTLVFATSRPAGEPVADLTEAREILGYEPRDTWPEGLPFEVG